MLDSDHDIYKNDDLFGSIFETVLLNKSKSDDELIQLIQETYVLDKATAEGFYDSVFTCIERDHMSP